LGDKEYVNGTLGEGLRADTEYVLACKLGSVVQKPRGSNPSQGAIF